MSKEGDRGQQGGSSDPGAGDSNQIKVDIGGQEKVLTADEVKTLVEKGTRLEQTVGKLSGFQKVLERYGNISPDEYISNSEAALALANSLIEKGIIDETGNIIEKKSTDKEKERSKGLFSDFSAEDSGVTKQMATIVKALSKVTNKIDALEDSQSKIFRRNIERDVRTTYPNLNDEDVSKLLAISQHDRSKSFWDHAKDYSEEKKAMEVQSKQTVAKEVVETLVKVGIVPKDKIDLDKFDINSLKEQDPSGGAPVYEGKKFMFKSRMRKLKEDDRKGFTLPAEGMKEMLDKNLG